MKKWIKRFYVIFFILIILLIILRFDEFKDTFSLIKKENLNFLILAFIAQLLTYISVAITYKSLLAAMKYYVNFFKLFKLSIVVSFLNNMIPSLGLSGNTALFHSLKTHHKVSEGKIIISISLSGISTGIAFVLVLLFAFIMLVIRKNLDLISLILLIIAALIIVVVALLLFESIKNRRYFANFIEKIATRLFRIFKKEFNKEKFDYVIEEFYEGIKIMRNDKKHFLIPLVFSLVKILLDVITIYLIFLSFNVKISIPIIILGLTIGSVLGIISFLPGGLGIFELTTSGIYTGLGVNFGIALETILIFRFLSYWLPNLIGFLIYKHTLEY